MSIKSLFEDIADAIREKSGSSDTYTPAEMPSAIRSIPSGSSTASGVSYDNTSSGLTASNVQDAIDELSGDVSTINSDLSELNSNLQKNKFGANVNISSYDDVSNPFTVPADGVLMLETITPNVQNQCYAIELISGTVFLTARSNGFYNGSATMPVRQGMQIYLGGNSIHGKYRPYI